MSTVQIGERQFHRVRDVLAEVRLEFVGDLLGSLTRNETTGDLGAGLGREHRLGSFARETTPDTVAIQRWASRRAFQRSIAGLRF